MKKKINLFVSVLLLLSFINITPVINAAISSDQQVLLTECDTASEIAVGTLDFKDAKHGKASVKYSTSGAGKWDIARLNFPAKTIDLNVDNAALTAWAYISSIDNSIFTQGYIGVSNTTNFSSRHITYSVSSLIKVKIPSLNLLISKL